MRSMLVYAPEPQAQQWLPELATLLRRAEYLVRPLRWSPDQTPESELLALVAHPAEQPAALLCLAALHDLHLAALNRVCHALRLPLLCLDMIDATVQVGPAVMWGQTACLACLSQLAPFFMPADLPKPSQTRFDGPTFEASVQRWLGEIADFLNGAPESRLRRGYVLRLSAGTDEWHYRALKNPACTVCSTYSQYPTEIAHHAPAAGASQVGS